MKAMGDPEKEVPEEAVNYYADALSLLANRNPGLASVQFDEASKLFLDKEQNLLSTVSKAMSCYCASLEKAMGFNYASALEDLVRGKSLLEESMQGIPDENRESVQSILSEAEYLEPFYYGLNASISFDYDTAADKFNEASEVIANQKRNVRQDEDTSGMWQYWEGFRLYILGQSEVARAQFESESGNPQQAVVLGKAALTDFGHARDKLQESGLPQSEMLSTQCNMFTMQLIPSLLRHFARETQFEQQNASLEKKIFDLEATIAKAATVSSTVTVSPTISATISPTINQTVEASVRVDLRDLLDQLSKQSAQNPQAKALQDEGDQALQDSGSGFWEKARRFAPKVLDFAKAAFPPASPFIALAEKFLESTSGNPSS
jgi:hypothetical protein